MYTRPRRPLKRCVDTSALGHTSGVGEQPKAAPQESFEQVVGGVQQLQQVRENSCKEEDMTVGGGSAQGKHGHQLG